METVPMLSSVGSGRKKLRDVSKWKCTLAKNKRHRPKSLPALPKCIHKRKTFYCSELTMQDVRKFHQAFYSHTTKVEQDNFILKYTSQSVPKRRRTINNTRNRAISLRFFVMTKKGMQPICSSAFQSILGISKFRIQSISKKFLNTRTQAKENRGGDRKSKQHEPKLQRVVRFILKLKCIESHYTRDRSQKQYMASDCSIRKLWRFYCQENKDLPVKYDFFRKIFVEKFNISFKSPTTDACSECIRLKEQIASPASSEVKTEAMVRLRVHKLKAKAFYDLLKDKEEHTIKLSFDCQKNMVLPRVPDQQAYYSRQLYFYNFTICEGDSHAKQTKDVITAYTWTENERNKGSNEMVYHKLMSLQTENITSINIFCDGCPGQNKNVTMMGMLMTWLYRSKSPTTEVTITFPIVGHSFLPPDRIFGRIEKVVKKKDTILTPSEYRSIFTQFSTALELQRDFMVQNWKTAVEEIVKPPGQWHFQFSTAKRISLKKRSNGSIVVKGEVNYKSDTGVYRSVLRKGKSLATLNPDVLPNKVNVKVAKLKDVEELLKKHYGPEWRMLSNVDLTFYSNILDNVDENRSVDEDEIEEENIEEDDGLRI